MSKSRICIVTPRSINDSPCLEKYREIIQEPYDIIYWSKEDRERDCGAENCYVYSGTVPVEGGKLRKLWNYARLSSFAKKIIRKNQYKKLIIYPTHMAWLLQDLLHKHYRGNYLYDVRDYAGENNWVIWNLTAAAVRGSGLCTITSPAYLKFLPTDRQYVISHNVQPIDGALIAGYRGRTKSPESPIVLSFIGTVRFLEQQKKIISVFGNDNRFVLKYIGRGSEALKEFCEKGGYRNVQLIGQFDRAELGELYMDTDMAINVYGNDDPALVYALSNKLYSAAMMGMPVLASPKTYTAEIVEKYGFGVAVNLESPDCADEVYRYYRNTDHLALLEGCNAFMKTVVEQEDKYRTAVRAFIKA